MRKNATFMLKEPGHAIDISCHSTANFCSFNSMEIAMMRSDIFLHIPTKRNVSAIYLQYNLPSRVKPLLPFGLV